MTSASWMTRRPFSPLFSSRPPTRSPKGTIFCFALRITKSLAPIWMGGWPSYPNTNHRLISAWSSPAALSPAPHGMTCKPLSSTSLWICSPLKRRRNILTCRPSTISSDGRRSSIFPAVCPSWWAGWPPRMPTPPMKPCLRPVWWTAFCAGWQM